MSKDTTFGTLIFWFLVMILSAGEVLLFREVSYAYIGLDVNHRYQQETRYHVVALILVICADQERHHMHKTNKDHFMLPTKV